MTGSISEAERAEPQGEKKGRRERSTIEFPYGDLDDAFDVARAIHENAGLSCSPDQLAAYLAQVSTSGAFRSKIATARIFGIVGTERGSVTLTDLGRNIVDEANEAHARAQAFRHVPLYQAVFEKYRGGRLPPAAALEREFASLGVASKQTGKARQAFERSAEQAGFFAAGKDRLVEPTGGNAEAVPVGRLTLTSSPPSVGSGGGGGGGDYHPFIQGLLGTLPEAGGSWTNEDRVKWLRTAANIFDLMYSDPGERVITIDLIGDAQPLALGARG